MAKPPAPPPPPPKKDKKPKGTAYQQYINAHPKLKRYAQQIYNSAIAEGLDPVYWAAVINTEYVPGPQGPETSPKGAIGPAQIMPMHVGDFAPWLNRRLTAKDLQNDATNIRFGAYYFSQALRNHGGNYEAAYNNSDNRGGVTYNSGGPNPFTGLKAAPGGGLSPTERAQNAQEYSTTTRTLTDPWAVIDKSGRLKYVNAQVAPKNVVTYAGQPMTKSSFLQAWQGNNGVNDQYLAYTGKNATAAQVAYVLSHGISTYELDQRLSKSPAFYHSPVWKTRAPSFVAAWHGIYGPRSKPDKAFIAKAIASNIQGDAFADMIRSRKDYTGSLEFKQNATTMRGAYENIYGTPDAHALTAIRQATLNGWSADQFQQYLRSLPEYSHSNEYRDKALNFLDAIGMITGRVPTAHQGPPLKQRKGYAAPTGYAPGGVTYGPGGPEGPLPPYDPRLPQAQVPTPAGSGLVVQG